MPRSKNGYTGSCSFLAKQGKRWRKLTRVPRIKNLPVCLIPRYLGASWQCLANYGEFSGMAPAVGFEPTTRRLTVARSTTELRWNTAAESHRTRACGIPTNDSPDSDILRPCVQGKFLHLIPGIISALFASGARSATSTALTPGSKGTSPHGTTWTLNGTRIILPFTCTWQYNRRTPSLGG